MKKGFKEIYDQRTQRNRIAGKEMIVKFKKGYRKSKLQKFALRNNLKIKKKLGERTYVFEDYSQDHLLATLNQLDTNSNLKKINDIESVDLDEYRLLSSHNKRRKNKVENFSLNSQWHLRNDGNSSVSREHSDINIEPAWQITKGQGVKVAVIDTGFDIGHFDINYANTGYSVISGRYNAKAPAYTSENHGTAVAGLIAGKDNKKGIMGVASEAQIIPIRLIGQGGLVPVSDIIAAHLKAVEMGAQVINNSWGTTDSSLAEDEKLELSADEENLYSYLANRANNGKGVVVVFAAGNSGNANFNAHPEARSEHTLSVGAMDSKDLKARYSVYGAELDVVAYGGQEIGILTTDRRDSKRRILGYARGSFTDTFTGTSAAAPLVSGVAALVLSVNPRLTANDVKEIIKQSARADLGNKYEFNGEKSLEIGHGVIDAAAAVRLAQTWK